MGIDRGYRQRADRRTACRSVLRGDGRQPQRPLAPDGSYTVFGIPGNLGAIRARATCSDGSIGQSRVGFTNPFQPDIIELGPITWGQLDPIPIAATLSAPDRFLTTGETSQLTMTAVAADGSQANVTARSAGTVYALSNTLLASVTEDGLIRVYPVFAAGSSARLVVTATTEGAVSSTYMYILGPRGSLTGRVLRADGTTPVIGAQVSIVRLQTMDQAGTAVTDTLGRFRLDDVSAGSFLISGIDPATGDRAMATARLETEGQVVDADLRLHGQGIVRVTVVGATDAPVPNAEVTLTTLGGFREVRTLATNAAGEASFAGIGAGLFTVSTRQQNTQLVGTAVGTLAVGETLPMTLRLQSIGTIRGVAYDVDGQTLKAGVQIRLLSRERGILTQSVTTESGAFEFDTLPIQDGPFTLDAFIDGRLRARVPGIVIGNANDVVTRDVVLSPVGVVRGRVRNPLGEGYAGARVTMQSLVGLRLSFDALTTSDGVFVLPAVPVGEFELTAVTADLRTGRAQGRVATDAQVVERDVTIADDTLVGTVFQRDGVTPVGAGVAVYLASQSHGTQYTYVGSTINGLQRTETDAQGRFGFPVTRADRYYVQAEQNLDRGRTEAIVVNLNPSQPLESRIVFLAKGTVSGTVRNPGGVPQANIPVSVATRGLSTIPGPPPRTRRAATPSVACSPARSRRPRVTTSRVWRASMPAVWTPKARRCRSISPWPPLAV
ncbi:MSCRAMM family protein [Tahibacter amnicola]|uniref:Carboxypeptidase-like regulatory domain-containing protein n=1 Tax=Tahibacter amnicola TaxID=2976241 RepID=A0ABY6BMS2_9GAMM|nr:carboxypeptidase-like regulatory domain-containing protein [Tahibacter amnicola]UXI70355.1 carboxypeptidase-like regulatory domain-containing protein [Tahibacter amnicola]